MKLKGKILSLGTIATITTPIVIAVSCGSSNDINWNINKEINGKTKNISIVKEDLLDLYGSDGHGTYKLPLSNKVEGLLKEAKATKKVEVLYFKDGPKAKWIDTTNNAPTNLSNYDQIRVSIKLNNPGYLVNGKDSFQLETSQIGLNSGSKYKFKKNWFKPSTQKPANALIDNGVVSSEKNKVVINLDEADSNIKINDLVMAIAIKLGYLFSETKLIKSFSEKDAKDRTVVMHLQDIYDSLVNAQSLAIDTIDVRYKGENSLLDLTNVLGGIAKGESFIKDFQTAELENGSDLTADFINAPKTPEFLRDYGVIATPITIPLLSLISGMKSNKEALKFFPELAINYGRVFKDFANMKIVHEWSKDNLIRGREIESIPQIFMATLFRNK
ncbi:hypothetical protein MYMA111404_04030 [Mycoplasma marinum]|uniref:Lipoprotein n=1 Tax=Mycoplasma marinum TaxID=1937190 RepID=A0A4R0XVD3_9MOLU|nr:hypothetical protein [Mycoplasma marinum]TCG10881.1 hypothetical protein C4B24_03655 [Mycoplasma marinum]